VNAGRLAAARVLIAIESGSHAEDLLPREAPRDEPDRGLAWFLVMGVLRRRGEVDAILRTALRQPLEDLDAGVRATLRLGAFERHFSRTPDHAAVDQAVELIAALGQGRAKGLINAVTRRATRPAEMSRADALNHPEWLVSRWSERYGDEATEAWCARNGEEPPLILVANGRSEELQATLESAGLEVGHPSLRGETLDGVLRVKGHRGRVELLPGYDAGAWWVQDTASVWMTDLVPDDAKTVLDACAAPGGKSFRLAARGATVCAVDISESRLKKMGESVRRLDLGIRYRQHNWLNGPLNGDDTFDAVLVDAPCTGLGVVRRHPEIRWRRSPFDPGSAAPDQATILQHAASHVRSGGALVYVVCSPEPEEGEEVIQAFLLQHPDFSEEARRCTAPPENEEDAFFGVRLRRS
jgi:16S rRNA (cytosine967-C5)-methyltransferase